MARIYLGNVKGPKGDTGATGATGPQGEAATIEVGSVSTTAYGNAAQVTNVGSSSAAKFNFVIPQGKPGEKTTKMGELTLDTITTSTEEFPSPAVGDTGATVFGKIVKFFSDVLASLTNKIDVSKIANDFTTTDASYVAAAPTVKALNDSLANKASTTELQTVENKIAKTINIEKTAPAAQLTLARYTCALIGNKIVLVDIAFNVTGTITSNVLGSMFYFPNREFLVATDLSAIKINVGGGQSTVVPFFANDSTNRIGVNGSQTSLLTSGTSWNLLGVVILK